MGLDPEPALGNPTGENKGTPGSGKSFFCAIDGLCYTSLDMALVHVKMQHGMVVHGEILVRSRSIGGGF